MIAFFVLGAIALLSSALVVLARNPVVSALWLALTFVSAAGLFVVLGAPFLATVQIVVYAGAILVFFLFVIMLLNLGRLAPAERGALQPWLGAWAAAAIGVVLAMTVGASGATLAAPGPHSAEAVARTGNTAALAIVLYRDYLFPFELASVLLTAAVVGAVVLARRRA